MWVTPVTAVADRSVCHKVNYSDTHKTLYTRTVSLSVIPFST